MKVWYKIQFLLLLWCAWPLALAHAQTTLADLDALLDRAPNLDAFLADQQLVDEYYVKLRDYLGSPFERASFDAIIKDLRLKKPLVPGLDERLWGRRDEFKDISLRLADAKSGREMINERWREWQKDYVASLEDLAGEDGRYQSRRSSGIDWRDQHSAIQERLRQFEEKLKSSATPREAYSFLQAKLTEAGAWPPERMSPIDPDTASTRDLRRMNDFLRGRYYLALENDPQVQRLAARHLQEIFAKEKVRDLLGSNDADTVIDLLKSIRNDPKAALGEEIASVVVSRMKRIAPDPEALLANREIFVPITKTDGPTTVDFRQVRRRLHGIFKGVKYEECVGGSCHALDNLTIERWGTAALDGELVFVERNGKYHGFQQMVPLEAPNGKRYASIDFGSPLLKHNVKIATPGGASKSAFLFEHWLRASAQNRRGKVEGYVMGRSHAMANAGMLDTVHGSPTYTLAPILGDSKDFRHVDPLAELMVKAAGKPGGLAGSYGGKMILEATVQGAGNLKPLTAFAPEFLERMKSDPELVKQMLRSRNVEFRRSVLEALDAEKILIQIPRREIVDKLGLRDYLADPDPEMRVRTYLRIDRLLDDASGLDPQMAFTALQDPGFPPQSRNKLLLEFIRRLPDSHPITPAVRRYAADLPSPALREKAFGYFIESKQPLTRELSLPFLQFTAEVTGRVSWGDFPPGFLDNLEWNAANMEEFRKTYEQTLQGRSMSARRLTMVVDVLATAKEVPEEVRNLVRKEMGGIGFDQELLTRWLKSENAFLRLQALDFFSASDKSRFHGRNLGGDSIRQLKRIAEQAIESGDPGAISSLNYVTKKFSLIKKQDVELLEYIEKLAAKKVLGGKPPLLDQNPKTWAQLARLGKKHLPPKALVQWLATTIEPKAREVIHEALFHQIFYTNDAKAPKNLKAFAAALPLLEKDLTGAQLSLESQSHILHTLTRLQPQDPAVFDTVIEIAKRHPDQNSQRAALSLLAGFRNLGAEKEKLAGEILVRSAFDPFLRETAIKALHELGIHEAEFIHRLHIESAPNHKISHEAFLGSFQRGGGKVYRDRAAPVSPKCEGWFARLKGRVLGR